MSRRTALEHNLYVYSKAPHSPAAVHRHDRPVGRYSLARLRLRSAAVRARPSFVPKYRHDCLP